MKKTSLTPPPKRQRLAVIGFGRLGRACAEGILADANLELAGVVRRPSQLAAGLPAPLAGVPTVAHISELRAVDAALICVPTLQVLETARGLLQHRMTVVECATLHGEAFTTHKAELDRLASHHGAAAVVGAGWDPGALSLLRGLFTVLIPKGHTETTHHPGAAVHHSTVAGTIAGVKKALTTELPGAGGSRQRYLYVELEQGANFSEVAQALRADPLFLHEETVVIPVPDLAAWEQDGAGIVVERREAATCGHQVLLLEARFSERVLAARMMLAAARALPTRHHRAYGLYDLPPRVLWAGLAELAERSQF